LASFFSRNSIFSPFQTTRNIVAQKFHPLRQHGCNIKPAPPKSIGVNRVTGKGKQPEPAMATSFRSKPNRVTGKGRNVDELRPPKGGENAKAKQNPMSNKPQNHNRQNPPG